MPEKVKRIDFEDIQKLGIAFRYRPKETKSISSGTEYYFRDSHELKINRFMDDDNRHIKKYNDKFINVCTTSATRHIVNGDVKKRVQIIDAVREFDISGNIRQEVNLQVGIGNFKVRKKVGPSSKLKTQIGNVHVIGGLKKNTDIKISLWGNIHIQGNIEKNCSLMTARGNISIDGSIGENCSICTPGIVFFKKWPSPLPRFSQIPRQVIVNGDDCTHEIFPPVFPVSTSKQHSAGSHISFQGNRPPPFNPEASAPKPPEICIAPAMQEYLDSFSDQQEKFVDAFSRLKLEPPEDFLCPISHDIPNHPVRVDGMLFDYNSLLAIRANEDGSRNNPLTQRPFHLNQIQPARDIKQHVEAMISNADFGKEKEGITAEATRQNGLKFFEAKRLPATPPVSEARTSVSCSTTCTIM